MTYNKKAQLEFLGAAVVLVVVVFGGYFIIEESRLNGGQSTITGAAVSGINYVGNVETKVVCPINNYDMSKIPEGDRVFFRTLEEAQKLDFVYRGSC